MKNFTLLLLVFLPIALPAQTSLKNIRDKSYEVFVYKVAEASAEKYIAEDSIPVDQFLGQTPAYIFRKDSVNTHILPVGQYVFMSLEQANIVADLVGITNLIVYPINNHYNMELDIRTQDGIFVPDAKVCADGKEANYNADAGAYLLRQRKIKSGFVKVYAPGDTTFTELEAKESRHWPIWKQRWNNFKMTKVGKLITYLPEIIRALIRGTRRYKSDRPGTSGYVLFNQPKYKLTDTVKLKAYIVNRKWKQYTQKANLYLMYYDKGKMNEQLLTDLSPVSPGSYVYSFPLSDTLVSDESYTIEFRNKEGKPIISKRFSTEDYLLDEIGSYQMRVKNESCYAGDTLELYASAKDANGLPLLDGRATLVLTTETIGQFYKDSLQVPDTLFVQEKPLAAEGETVFTLAADALPNARLSIKAAIIFHNSNNEQHEESKEIFFSPGLQELVVTSEADSVFATYRMNGKPVQAEGSVTITGDELNVSKPVLFPARLKADPLAEKYLFRIVSGKDTLARQLSIDQRYDLTLSRISREDTLGFTLHNPYQVPVTFIVLDGNSIVANGKEDSEEITWKTTGVNKRKIYTVKWQYMWEGEQQEGAERIALLYKMLQVRINKREIVFPGQKDSVTIEVKDYKNRPAAGVNLAAVAYNSQFKNNIDVREPPYLVKYKSRPTIIRDDYETDDPYISKRYKLGNNKGWLARFAVDTMPYYKILFPAAYPYDVVTPIADFIPQVSIHVVQKGQPQEIYLLYINRQLVYFNGVTDRMKYAFQTLQGYAQAGMRLRDKYIQTDSIYIQPFYKHDIIIDLDSLPPHSTVKDVPAWWTNEEKNIIEASTWQLDNNYKTNDGIVWQYGATVHLSTNARHLVGPFNPGDSLHFFAPGDFDIHFKFEPGYEYNLSRQVARLEKKSIFPAQSSKINLGAFAPSSLVLGDTITYPPIISYPNPATVEPFIKTSAFYYSNYNLKAGNGKLQFTVAKDTALRYVILYNKDTSLSNIVLKQHVNALQNIVPGIYTLLLVSKDFKTAKVPYLEIKSDQTLCFNASVFPFEKNNSLINEMIKNSMAKAPVASERNFKKEVKRNERPLPQYAFGNNTITGKVIDLAGKNVIFGVSVMIKGTLNGTSTDANGNFLFANIRAGTYVLIIASVGYQSREIRVEVENENSAHVNVALSMLEQRLSEVVVTGFATIRKKSMTGSIASLRGEELSSGYISNSIQGRIAGIATAGAPGESETIHIRGIVGLAVNDKPIYVVDGIIYNELPKNVTPEMIQSAEILKDAAATAIYGARGANGVVIIETGSKTQRNKFSDNAIWQPELFTNEQGKVTFEVVYPDNITGWRLYALAMDKKRRMGKGMSFTKAYKPLMAQLSAPQFLIMNDSAEVIGKTSNYTADNYSIQTRLLVEDHSIYSHEAVLSANATLIAPVSVTTNGSDTLHTSFTLRTSTGFNDGEDRKIPVFKRGSEEASGNFYVLQNDTTFTFNPADDKGSIEVYAQNNTLDILLHELDHLKQYPYYCMEQTASKLRGLAMEQQIRAMLKQPFKNEKEMNALLKKLQDNQLFDGGWCWWERGKANLHITAYIVEALLQFRNNPITESNIRNGLLFLQNQLPYAKLDELLQILSTMSAAGHFIDYKTLLAKIRFDSLSQHQQWQWVQICQQQHLQYETELKKLLNEQVSTMTGDVHWGVENYQWYSNAIATTSLAFSVLKKEPGYSFFLPRIIQYFLAQRQHGFWRNTVESASVTASVLPYILESNSNFQAPASIHLASDSAVTIDTFPYSGKLFQRSTKPLTIHKTGGGITYFTLYQKWWNERPEAVTDKFIIHAFFEKNGQKIEQIPAGGKVKMIVQVNVLQDAEYAMIEIPIPAGCNYAGKNQDDWKMHKEFYKHKMVLFSESLPKGLHQFEIELEARYKGTYTINPAKAELMYFPTMFGRNNMSRVKIE